MSDGSTHEINFTAPVRIWPSGPQVRSTLGAVVPLQGCVTEPLTHRFGKFGNLIDRKTNFWMTEESREINLSHVRVFEVVFFV